MKKFIVTPLIVAALVLVPVSAQAVMKPQPGKKCDLTGASRIMNQQAFVCLPTGVWSKALPKSQSPLKTKDMWVKAAEAGMTAGFGMVTNPTDQDIRVIAARSPRFATSVQLHEVVKDSSTGAMVMQEKQQGFVIPAGQTVMLKPGGDHIMMMGIKQPITAGKLIPVMLIGSNGEQLRFTALGKVFSGANENYDHSGM